MFRSVILLLVLVTTNSGFSVKKVKISPKVTSDSDVYSVIRDEDGLKIFNPKPQEPVLREIEYFRVVEKPYNVNEKSTRPPMNGHGYQFYPLEESREQTTDPPELAEINRIFTNGHGYQFFPPKESKEDKKKVKADVEIAYPDEDKNVDVIEFVDSDEDEVDNEDDKLLKSGIKVEKNEDSQTDDVKDKQAMSRVNATAARSDIFNYSKKKYGSPYSRYVGGVTGKRQKRDMTQNIPPAPVLPPMTYEQAQELVRRILNNDKTTQPTPPGPSRLNVMNNGADLVINNTLSFFPPPNIPNLRSDYVPKTYGMSLNGNEGFTWNNIADPRRPQDINFNILNQNEQTKRTSTPIHPAEIMKQLHLKLDNISLVSENIKNEEKSKKAEFKVPQKSDDANKMTKDVNPEAAINNTVKSHNDIQSISKKIGHKSDLQTEVDLHTQINKNNNEFIDVRSQMEEMFSRMIPPPPRLEDSEKYTPGTYGMRLNNGQGVTWNNLGKPMASKPTIFTTPKPYMDNQTKNIQPKDPEMPTKVPKVYQQLFETENIEVINDEAPENYNEIDETIPTIVFNDDNDDDDVAKIINPRSYAEPVKNENGYSLNAIPTPPKLPELNFKDGPVLNVFKSDPYSKQNNVQNNNANVDKELQEKYEKSFEDIMNKMPGLPFPQPEENTTKTPEQNRFNSETNSFQNKVQNDEQNNKDKPVDEALQERMANSFNDIMNKIDFKASTDKNPVSDNKKPVLDDRVNINTNKLVRGGEGTYGMEIKGDQGYVWNKLSPNNYAYYIGEQQTEGDVEGFTNEDEKQTENPDENSTKNPVESHKITEGTTEATYLPTKTPGIEITVSSTEVPCATNAEKEKEISTTTVATTVAIETTKMPEGNKDCNTTEAGVNSNVLNTTTESTLIDTTKPADDEANGSNGSDTNVSNTTPVEETTKTTVSGLDKDINSTSTPRPNTTTVGFTEFTTVKVENHDENSTGDVMTTTESMKETTKQPSDSDDVSPTIDDPATTTETGVTTIKPIEGTSSPPTNNTTRPLNLNDLLQSAEFWQWLSNWTVPYMEVMNETVKELVKEEVAKQFAEREANNSNIENNKPTTGKPIDNQINNTNNDSKDKTSMKVEAQTIYGNSLNDKQVTNIFVFYPNKTFNMDDIKALINNNLNANKLNNTTSTGNNDGTIEHAESSTENGLEGTSDTTQIYSSTISNTESTEATTEELSNNDIETSTASELDETISTAEDKGTTTEGVIEATTEINSETTERPNDATETVTESLDITSISTTLNEDMNSSTTKATVEIVTEKTTEMANNELITTDVTESSATELTENITEANIVSTVDAVTNGNVEITTETVKYTSTTEPEDDMTIPTPMENGDMEISTEPPKTTELSDVNNETTTGNINESDDSVPTSASIENISVTESMLVETTTNSNDANSTVGIIINDVTAKFPEGSTIDYTTDEATLSPIESSTEKINENKTKSPSVDHPQPTTESYSDTTKLEEEINGQSTTELPNVTMQIISTEEANTTPIEIVTEITTSSPTTVVTDITSAESIQDITTESTTELSQGSTVTEIDNDISSTAPATTVDNSKLTTESDIVSTTEVLIHSTTSLNDAVIESTTVNSVSEITTNSETDNDGTESSTTEKSKDNDDVSETPVEITTEANTNSTIVGSDVNPVDFTITTTIAEEIGTTEMTTEQLSGTINDVTESSTTEKSIDNDDVSETSVDITTEGNINSTTADSGVNPFDHTITTTMTEEIGATEMTTEHLSENVTENGSKNETDASITENTPNDNDELNVTVSSMATEENKPDDLDTGSTEPSSTLTTDNDVTLAIENSVNKDEGTTVKSIDTATASALTTDNDVIAMDISVNDEGVTTTESNTNTESENLK